jgi:hypothetical protein
VSCRGDFSKNISLWENIFSRSSIFFSLPYEPLARGERRLTSAHDRSLSRDDLFSAKMKTILVFHGRKSRGAAEIFFSRRHAA